MDAVLSAIAIIPSAPVMVPQLAGGAAAELADLHEAVVAAASALPDRWVAIGVADANPGTGVGDAGAVIGPHTAGTFAGYGVDVRVTLAPGGYDPDSLPLQHAFDEALAGGDVVALTRLPRVITARTAFEVLAGLAEPGPRSAEQLYRGAPYGVGYFAGIWTP